MSLDFIEPDDAPEISASELKLKKPRREGYCTVELPAEDYEKLQAFWSSGLYEKAAKARDARLDDCLKSAEIALNWALRHDCSGAHVFATLLASLYNGQRVKFDVSDLRLLDAENFEHALNVMRLSFETSSEPHTWFPNGGRLFEKMIADWRLEKKPRAKS
jgi:hypothetical protein